ncbi:MAG: hypothetical protein MUF49_03285 [Oculatellaceae cyanobacterium Prado106]|jgi:hypothetical protein|nr:hypothetical protein [Oculatellaceae cyanobacterium Prado106]
MLLTQLAPLIPQLSHAEKLSLLHLLTAELIKDSEVTPLNLQAPLPELDPEESFEAAAVLAKALAKEVATTC